MKKFNLLRASSLILASYFIIGFSSCSNQKKQDNGFEIKNYYQETNLNNLLIDNLGLTDYINKSVEFREAISNFNNLYNNIYIFSFPSTYQEYQLFTYNNEEMINVGYFSKSGTKITFEFITSEENYDKTEVHFFKYDLAKNLEKYEKTIIYLSQNNNSSYREVTNENECSYSFVYGKDSNEFEVALIKSENYLLRFTYELLNNVEVLITEEEYNILLNSLTNKFKQNDLSSFLSDNKDLLFELLKKGEEETISFEYDSIYKKLNDLTSNGRTRVK